MHTIPRKPGDARVARDLPGENAPSQEQDYQLRYQAGTIRCAVNNEGDDDCTTIPLPI